MRCVVILVSEVGGWMEGWVAPGLCECGWMDVCVCVVVLVDRRVGGWVGVWVVGSDGGWVVGRMARLGVGG